MGVKAYVIGAETINDQAMSQRMNRFDLILRKIVFFLFPIPFLLSFAMEHYGDWTAYVAYATALRLGYLQATACADCPMRLPLCRVASA